MRSKNSRGNRPATYIQIVPDPKGSPSDSLDFFSTELRNDRPPLAYGGGADVQRPRDIRGLLEVIDNVAFQHEHSLSLLKRKMQVRSDRTDLTSVHMEKLNDLADRLADAMKEAAVNGSDLARECRVSPAAVTKWLNRETRKLTAENYAAAGRALGVRDEWLRTGKLPREREKQEVQMERLQAALRELREPLTALLAVVDELSPPTQDRKRRTGG